MFLFSDLLTFCFLMMHLLDIWLIYALLSQNFVAKVCIPVYMYIKSAYFFRRFVETEKQNLLLECMFVRSKQQQLAANIQPTPSPSHLSLFVLHTAHTVLHTAHNTADQLLLHCTLHTAHTSEEGAHVDARTRERTGAEWGNPRLYQSYRLLHTTQPPVRFLRTQWSSLSWSTAGLSRQAKGPPSEVHFCTFRGVEDLGRQREPGEHLPGQVAWVRAATRSPCKWGTATTCRVQLNINVNDENNQLPVFTDIDSKSVLEHASVGVDTEVMHLATAHTLTTGSPTGSTPRIPRWRNCSASTLIQVWSPPKGSFNFSIFQFWIFYCSIWHTTKGLD